VPDPIHSSSWTGPPDPRERKGIFTHGPGEPVYTSDYQRLLSAQRRAMEVPTELRPVLRLATFLLLSPVVLVVAWISLKLAISEQQISNNVHVLVLWGLSVIALAASQVTSRSTRLIPLRRLGLSALLCATFAVAGGYFYLGRTSYAHARALRPERTFELYKTYGSRSYRQTVAVHQRPDGSTIEGISMGPPVPYAPVCTLVQRLQGDHGFAWTRVLERSQGSELMWSIRRQDCFGARPVSSLKG
jgi:hypothetical protein